MFNFRAPFCNRHHEILPPPELAVIAAVNTAHHLDSYVPKRQTQVAADEDTWISSIMAEGCLRTVISAEWFGSRTSSRVSFTDPNMNRGRVQELYREESKEDRKERVRRSEGMMEGKVFNVKESRFLVA